MRFPKKKWSKKNTSKYYNKRCRCNLNHMHDSKFEARHCNHLRLLVLAGEINSFKSQKSFHLHGKDGKTVCSHIPDFLITHNDGSLEVHECKSKGTVTQIWRLKKTLFEIEYPEIPYTVIWM